MEYTTAAPSRATGKKRPWQQRTFYVSEQMAVAAHRISELEEKRTGRQVGAGQIIDRAMRQYVAERFSPDEFADLLNGNAND